LWLLQERADPWEINCGVGTIEVPRLLLGPEKSHSQICTVALGPFIPANASNTVQDPQSGRLGSVPLESPELAQAGNRTCCRRKEGMRSLAVQCPTLRSQKAGQKQREGLTQGRAK
jgi:hypothetical protein